MLSYLHGFHAGNLADVHKHTLLAWMIGYLTRKPKPLSYIETHAGRGMYHLDSAEARKTGEAAQGIAQAGGWSDADHPYTQSLAQAREAFGATAYPGSPWIANALLRAEDVMHLAELHPTEQAELRQNMPTAHVHAKDGFEMLLSLTPPTPRRGLCLIDPSFEVKDDYTRIPRIIGQVHRKWAVGIIALWYPILTDARHAPMISALTRDHPDALCHEVHFPPARPGHGMVGSGLFVINPPYGLADEGARLSAHFATLPSAKV